MRKLFLGIIFVLVLLTASCIGVEAEISISRDGSGQIALEYRISNELYSLGALDGNQRWPTVPADRADFERTISRLPGIRLISFSSSKENRDIVNRVKLGFADLDALMSFLNDAGGHASLSRNNPARLTLILNEGNKLDGDLAALLQLALADYKFKLTAKSFLSASAGKTTEYSSPMGDLVSSGSPVIVELDL